MGPNKKPPARVRIAAEKNLPLVIETLANQHHFSSHLSFFLLKVLGWIKEHKDYRFFQVQQDFILRSAEASSGVAVSNVSSSLLWSVYISSEPFGSTLGALLTPLIVGRLGVESITLVTR